jgi:hypothetical protein
MLIRYAPVHGVRDPDVVSAEAGGHLGLVERHV